MLCFDVMSLHSQAPPESTWVPTAVYIPHQGKHRCKDSFGDGIGCYLWEVTFLGKWKKVKEIVAQLRLTLYDPMGYSLLASFLCPWNYPGKITGGLPFPSPGDLPNPGIKPRSPALQVDSFPGLSPQGSLLPWEALGFSWELTGRGGEYKGSCPCGEPQTQGQPTLLFVHLPFQWAPKTMTTSRNECFFPTSLSWMVLCLIPRPPPCKLLG